MKLNFCPECAAPLQKHSDTKYSCANGHMYWNNPRATVTAILLRDGEALFAKRAIEPQKGKYDFPGGFVEYGEDSVAAVRRELFEETGLQATELVLVGSSAQSYIENITVCDFIFACRSWMGTMAADDDVAELEWKPIDFINSTEFAWHYSHLVQKLQVLVRGGNTL